MSPRGRHAALPPTDHARPEYLSDEGLVVHHYNSAGRVKDYDFATLPVPEPMQRSLAALFAARCTPHRWTTHRSSHVYWNGLLAFTEYLSCQPMPPRDLDELTVTLLKRWREHSLGAGTKNYHAFQLIRSLVGQDSRLQTGPVADELTRRAKMPLGRTQSYTEAELDQIILAAKQSFRAALRRIERNAEHLQRWRDGQFSDNTAEWVLGECLDTLAKTATLPQYTNKWGKRILVKPYRTVIRQHEGQRMRWHVLLFLSRMEAASLGVLLMAEFGWNLSVIDRIEVPRSSPDPGQDGHPTYRIQLEKPRRSAERFETRNVTDDGAGSPGRLITHALAATRFARGLLEEHPDTSPDRLIVWRTAAPARNRTDQDRQPPVGEFGFGIDTYTAQEWGRTIAGIGGSPFRRGRRTVVALDRREPTQHSQDTHDRHYVLVDKRVQADAVATIAAGAEDAAARAHTAVLVAELRISPTPGDVQTATADCGDFDNSPYSKTEGRCDASFLTCLGCVNAHIHPGHHPRLAHLHRALTNLRSVMPPAAWEADWGNAHARLEDLKHRLGEGIWAAAVSRVTADDHTLIDHLLTGDLDR